MRTFVWSLVLTAAAADDSGPKGPAPAWPGFRGPARDNVSRETVRLAERWPEAGPPLLWSLELGEGYAGAAVHSGRVYVLDHDTVKHEDVLRCFSLGAGKDLWRLAYPVDLQRYHGYSRTVPAVSAKHVIAIGPRGHVTCADAATGALRWTLDLPKTYGTSIPPWYTAQCPVLDGTTAVVAPCGKDALIVGLDAETGAVRWTTPNPRALRMSHSSIVPMVIGGRKTWVYAAVGGIVGIAAEGSDAGSLLWESREWESVQVISPSPVLLEDGLLFITAGYGAGSLLLRISQEGGTFKAGTVWKLAVKQGLASEQQSPIHHRRRVYSLQPADAGPLKDQLVCMDPYADGKILWTSGARKRFGHYEPFLLADGKLFLLTETGELVLVRAGTDAYEELARAQVLKGRDAWAPMAIVDGRLILRDSFRMICLDVRAPP